MPHCDVDGKRIFYARRGRRGRASLLLIHGSGGTHRNWSHQLEALSDDYDVVAPDLPGHGRSGGGPPAGVAPLVEFAARFAELVVAGDGGPRAETLFVGGHSLGGAVVQELALGRPDLVAGAILVGTGARLRVAPQVLESLAAGHVTPEFIRMAYSPEADPALVAAGEGEWALNPPALLYADLKACDGFDSMDRLAGFGPPALVICGEHDRLTPPKYSEFLARGIPRARLVMVPGAGHMVALERPARVNVAVREFIEATVGAGPGP